MQWYYSKNSTQLGPISDAEFRGKVTSGEILPTDMVWKEGMADWLPVSSVQELAGLIRPQQMVGGVQQSPYQPPVSQPYSQPMMPGTPIPNYLWQSIVVTVLCCVPFGIPAIVYASKVDGLVARGDTQGAIDASGKAKKWCLVALISWFVAVGLYLLIAVGVVASSGAS